MAGTRQSSFAARHVLTVYQAATVAAGSVPSTVWEFVAPFNCEVGAIKFNAQSAGSGAGNTVMDVLLNGTSIWTTAANRPTLATASTGEFTNVVPDGTKAIKQGDRLLVQIATSPATNTHGRIMGSVVLNLRG